MVGDVTAWIVVVLVVTRGREKAWNDVCNGEVGGDGKGGTRGIQ